MTATTASPGRIAESGTKFQPDLFKRKLKIRQVVDSDLAYFWAAYQDGSFADLLMPGLEPETFRDTFIDTFLGGAQYDWVAVSDKPLGLFLGNPMAAGRGAEVQVDWMPWTTPRQRLEATATFLRESSKLLKIFIFSDAKSEDFFMRLTRYRMLRRGCKVLNYAGGGEHALMFYTATPT